MVEDLGDEWDKAGYRIERLARLLRGRDGMLEEGSLRVPYKDQIK